RRTPLIADKSSTGKRRSSGRRVHQIVAKAGYFLGLAYPGRAPASEARRRADPGSSAKRRAATILCGFAAILSWTPDLATALRAARSGARKAVQWKDRQQKTCPGPDATRNVAPHGPGPLRTIKPVSSLQRGVACRAAGRTWALARWR